MELFEAVGRYLATERGSRPVFGLLGDANLGYMAAFVEREGGTYIAAVSESGAVSMGDGWARSSGDVGVVSVTQGPALTNTLTALTEATRSNTPIVLLSGSTPEVNEHFQYIDTEGFARLAGAGFLKVRNASEVLTILDRAFSRASGSRLPVVVDIPTGLLRSDVSYKPPQIVNTAGQQRLPDVESVAETATLLSMASSPLLIVGRGAVEACAREELLQLARLANAPIVTTLRAKDYFTGEPENLGILGGLSTPPILSYLAYVDVIVSFGASLNRYTTNEFSVFKEKILIQSDIDPSALSKYGPATHAVIADSKSFAAQVLEKMATSSEVNTRAPHMDEIAAADFKESRDMYVSRTANGTVDMRDAATWLSDTLPSGAQQVCDVGRFGYSTWPHILVDPERWFYIGSFGSIGLGLASAIGVAIAGPDNLTALYVGDGGMMQGLAELSTAVRNELPLIVMVLNDQCYGAEYLKLQQFEVSSDHSMMEWPSFAELAESMGASALRATSMEDLERAACMIHEGQFPILIEVIADPRDVPNEPSVVPLGLPMDTWDY